MRSILGFVFILVGGIFLFSSESYALAGQRDKREERVSPAASQAARRDASAEARRADSARTNPPVNTPITGTTSGAIEVVAKPCPIEKVKMQLATYCAASVCDSSMGISGALKLAGINIDGLDGNCQANIWKEIAGRVEMTYRSFKIECDRMNSDYSAAIEDWKTKYDEMAAKQAKTKKAAIIGTAGGAAGGIGLGILGKTLWDNKNKTTTTEE